MQLTCSYDTGAKALGPEKTISGKLQETLTSATQQARAVDEQRGISKTATDVRFSYCTFAPAHPKLASHNIPFYSTTVLLACALVAVRTEGQGVLHYNV